MANGDQYAVRDERHREEDIPVFPHQKKSRKSAVIQLQTTLVSTAMAIFLLCFNYLPKAMRNPGWIFIFIGLVVAVGIVITANLIGAYNLYKATEIGADPALALRQAKCWKICAHISFAILILLMIALPFDYEMPARLIVGAISLAVIGVMVVALFFGNKPIKLYIGELEEYLETGWSSPPPPSTA